MVTDKRNAAVTKSEMRPGFQKAKVRRSGCAAIIENGTEVPLDKTRIEFNEEKIDRIVSDVRDEAPLNAHRAT
jgi:hypothetical protein